MQEYTGITESIHCLYIVQCVFFGWPSVHGKNVNIYFHLLLKEFKLKTMGRLFSSTVVSNLKSHI